MLRGLYPPPSSEFGDSEKKRKKIYIFEVKFAYLDLKSQLDLCKVGVLLADLFLVGGNV